MTSDPTVEQALVDQVIFRMFVESVPRIHKCLDQLSDEDIWLRPNSETVSVGNLVLHLCGNVRQWVVSGLGGAEDVRERDLEFSETGPLPRADLLQLFDDTMAEARSVIESVDHATLTTPRGVQGQTETGVSILVHVTEHFSYHTGQITWFVKTRKAIDLGYYAGQDLNAKG